MQLISLIVHSEANDNTADDEPQQFGFKMKAVYIWCGSPVSGLVMTFTTHRNI